VCIVDQHVYRSTLGLDFRHRFLAGIKIGDIDFISLEIKSLFFHVRQPRVALGVAGRAGGHHFIAHAGELDADCLAQTAHAAGYHCHALCHCAFSSG